jgi:four helix bundle protein
MVLRHYQELIVWQKAMELTKAVYNATQSFPKEEIYGLRSQMRRAAVSIPSNIAEGQGRGSAREFLHGLRIARGSLFELESQIILGHQLSLMLEASCMELLSRTAEVGRIMNGLMKSLADPDQSASCSLATGN